MNAPAANARLRVVSITHGGVQRAMGRIRYEWLAARPDLDLKLVVPEVWREYGIAYQAEKADGLDVTIAPVRWQSSGPAKWYLHHYKSLGRILQKQSPDVIHLWEEPWSLVALQAAWLRDRFLPNAALVLETDQNILRRLPPPFEWIRRRTLQRTDLLIARQTEAEAVSRACGYTGPVRTVGYGVDKALFRPGSQTAARRRLGISEQAFVLGYVGRIIKAKGIFDVLDALASEPAHVQFLLLGTGPDRAAFEARASALGLTDRVRVMDPVGPSGVAAFMHALDVSLLLSRTLPTWKEQFGRVIIESQACGVPVIGSSSGSIPDVVGEGGWIIPEGDPKALAALLTRLRGARAELMRAAEAGVTNVATRYTYDRVGEQLLDVYRVAAAVAQRRTGSGAYATPSTKDVLALQQDLRNPYAPDATLLSSTPDRAHRAVPAKLDVVVVHETNGRKYLEALDELVQHQDIASVSFHGASVLWRFAHAVLRDRLPVAQAAAIASANLRFQLSLPFLRHKTVIIAVAPWDFRMTWLMFMLRPNRIIYNTSWPHWTGNRVPRRYGPLTPLFRHAFRAALGRPGVTAVTVTQAAAESLAACIPSLRPHVISHVVSKIFFAQRAHYRNPFRLLFVGELSEKKGFHDFLSVAERLGGAVEVDIVGEGPLRSYAEMAARRPGWRWHGKIADRAKLADIVSHAQVFVSLPHKTAKWEELFGMAVIEAMAVGLPCIVSNHIGPRGIITHERDGYLTEEGNLDVVVRWIRRLIDEPDRWRAVGTAAAERARDYSMESVSRLWRGVLIDKAPKVHDLDRSEPCAGPLPVSAQYG